jgi:hypothetical protein
MSRYCNLCGQPLRGSYQVYHRGDSAFGKGLVVCARCERNALRCTVCRIPIHPAASQDGVCPSCLTRAPICASCGRRIYGHYYRNGANGAVYCEACFKGLPRCDICGGLVGQGGYRLHDGRHICADCHATAIYDSARAGELYGRAMDVMARELGLQLSLPPSLHLVDRDQMLALLTQSRDEDTSHPELVFGLFVRRGRKRAIYVEYGLPQILMIEVLAHELAHAWQGENCPLLRDALVREGFAEWVAYRVLIALGAVKKAALMEQRADLYGQGLRLMLAQEKQFGPANVLRICRESALPDEQNKH